MPEAKSLRDLMRIRGHNRVLLDSVNGNLGSALGFKKRTGEASPTVNPAIIVFVPFKVNPKWLPESERLPKKLAGPDGLWCELDVVEGGKAEEETPVPEDVGELAERLRGWDEQIWVGSQISHWSERPGFFSMGTIGAFVKKRGTGKLGILTNYHVGVREDGQKQVLIHPLPWATPLATTQEAIAEVPDEKWYGSVSDEPNTWVRADCAYAPIVDGFNKADLNPWMMGVGKLGPVKEISLDDMSIIGQKVLRVGRTTGLRTGTVVAFGYEYADEPQKSGYTDLLIIGDDGKPFSTHGDSGSLIVTNDAEHRPVALLWGGWQEKLRTGYAQENWTYAIALTRVLDALKIDLVNEFS